MYHTTDMRQDRPILSKNIRWLIFWTQFFWMANINLSSGTMAAAGPVIKANIGLMDMEYGSISAIYGIGRVAGAIMFAFVINVVNRKFLLLVAVWIKVVTLVPYYFSSNGPLLIFVRCFSGIGHIWGVIYGPLWVSQYGVKKWLGFQNLVISAANPFGRGSGYLLDLLMTSEKYREGFLLNALGCFLCGVVFHLTPSIYFSSKLVAINQAESDELLTDVEKQYVSIFNVRKSEEGEKDVNVFRFNGNLLCNGVYMWLLCARIVIVAHVSLIQYWTPNYVQLTLGYKNKVLVTWIYFFMIVFNPVIGTKLGGYFVKCVGGYRSKNSMLVVFIFNLLAVCSWAATPWQDEWQKYLLFSGFYQVLGSAVLPSIGGIMSSCIDKADHIKSSWIIGIASVAFGGVPAPYVYGVTMDFMSEYDDRFGMKMFLCFDILGLVYVLIATCLRWKNLPANEYEGAEDEKLVGVEGTQDIHISPEVISNTKK